MAGSRVWKLLGAKEGDANDEGIVAAKSCRTLLVAFYDSQIKMIQYDEETGEYQEGESQSAEYTAG